MNRHRNRIVARIERLAALASLVLAAAGAAIAQAPEQVQYLPQDGAAIIVWMAPAGNVTGYNVYQTIVTNPGKDPAAPTKITPEPIKTTSYRVEKLENGTAYHFRVSAIVDGKESEAVGPFPARETQGSHVACVPQKPTKLAGRDGFFGVNIGTNYPGSHEIDADGVIKMRGSGWDIQSDADGFYFLAMQIPGDLTITARCVSGPTATSDGNSWNLAGPMIRESLDSRARLAMTQVAREGRLQFKRRTEFAASPPDTQTDEIEPTKRPVWLRLVRKGNDFTGFVSEDGSKWLQITDTETIPDFVKEPYVGLAVCAHQDEEYTNVTFDSVTITSP